MQPVAVPSSAHRGCARALALVAAALLVAGCGAEDPDDVAGSSGAPPAPGECASGELTLDDGSCVAAGLPDVSGCAPGSTLLDGRCVPAGTPASACAAGFVADGDGCVPVLPAAACPPGRMAVPGETVCRPVAPCPDTRYPEVPAAATVVHVDAGYAGLDSDGSADAPFAALADAVAAAPSDAVIALAAGTYQGGFELHQPLRFVGRCPEMVTITGQSGEPGILWFASGSSGGGVSDVALTGAGTGVLLSSALEVTVSRVWIHDVTARGISVERLSKPTSAMVTGSLIEGATGQGVVTIGGEVRVEGSVVRDTAPSGGHAAGVFGDRGQTAAERGRVVVVGSIIERHQGLGVYVIGSDAEVEGSVVRDTTEGASGGSQAVTARNDPGGDRATLSLRGSQVARSEGVALTVIGADATVDASSFVDTRPVLGAGSAVVRIGCDGQVPATVDIRRSLIAEGPGAGVLVDGATLALTASVVRDIEPLPGGEQGKGVEAQRNVEAQMPATLTVTGSRIAHATRAGIALFGATATVEGTLVADTVAAGAELHGIGITAFPQAGDGSRSWLSLRGSAVERSTYAGVMVIGSDAEIQTTAVRDTAVAAHGFYGRGVVLQEGSMVLRNVLVERSAEMGLGIVGAEVRLEGLLVRDTRPNGEGRFGDGIMVARGDAAASVMLLGSRVEGSARASLSSFGASVGFGDSVLSCAGFDIEGETFRGAPPQLSHLGGTVCGCPATEECQVHSGAGLAAPDAIEDAPPPMTFD
jgi:hypothetical protein